MAREFVPVHAGQENLGDHRLESCRCVQDMKRLFRRSHRPDIVTRTKQERLQESAHLLFELY